MKDLVSKIKMPIFNVKLPFYPPCEVKYGLQNGVLTQSIGLEFMYSFGKVLGTQNYPALGLISSHCILCLNPIKGTFNIVFILSHTH